MYARAFIDVSKGGKIIYFRIQCCVEFAYAGLRMAGIVGHMCNIASFLQKNSGRKNLDVKKYL